MPTTINANLTVDFSAPENWFGFEVVTFRATDDKGALAEDKILVVVVPVNDAPTLESIPKQEKEEGDQWVLDISQYMDDVDNNISELLLSVQSEVGQGYVTLVGTVLMFQYPEGIREDVITITVSDGELETTRSFIVNIESSPVIVPTLWDLIPWPWVFLLIIGTISGAFAYYKKRSRYWVYEAFLIHEKGLPIAHASHEESLELEDVVVSGMFTAVQNFINDVFSDQSSENDWELDKMEFGEHKILLERSQDLYLAVIFEGHSNKLRRSMKKLLLKIDEVYGNVLKDWDGDMDQITGIKEMTASLITKKVRKKPESRSSPAQTEPEPEKEEFVDILDGGEETKRFGLQEFKEYLERVEGELPDIMGAEETVDKKVLKEFKPQCPICGLEIEENDEKCSRCGVEFAEIKDLFSFPAKQTKDESSKKTPNGREGIEDKERKDNVD
jgi:rubrerythrin